MNLNNISSKYWIENLSLVVFLLMLAPVTSYPQTGTVTGRVVESLNQNKGVPAVTVKSRQINTRIPGEPTVTDKDGYFILVNQPSGPLLITAKKTDTVNQIKYSVIGNAMVLQNDTAYTDPHPMLLKSIAALADNITRPTPDIVIAITSFRTPILDSAISFTGQMISYSSEESGAGLMLPSGGVDEGLTIRGKISTDDGRIPKQLRAILSDDDTDISSENIPISDSRFTIMVKSPGDYTLTLLAGGYNPVVYLVVKTKDGLTIFTSNGEPVDPATMNVTLKATSLEEEQATSLANNGTPTRRIGFLPRLMEALPVSGLRSFDAFSLLVSGVAPPPETFGLAGPGISSGVGTAGQFSVNGLRSRENNFNIDGADNNDEDIGARRQGFISPTPQSVETLQELQVITTLPDARFGRNIAGRVNALTKSGGADLHGSAYGFVNHDSLNARDFFDLTTGNSPSSFSLTRSSDGKPVLLDGGPLVLKNPVEGRNPLTRFQAGGTLGGKIKNSDTFYFGSYEKQVIRARQEANFAVPTISQRGFFESGETGMNQGAARLFPSSLPGNAIFSLFPFPNNPRGPYGANTWTAALPADGDGLRLSVKVDHNFGGYNGEKKDLWKFGGAGDVLTVRYNLTDEASTLPVTGGALFSSLRPKVRTQNLASFYNRNLSSKRFDTFRFSFGRTKLSFGEARDSYLSSSSLFPGSPFLLNAPLLLNVTAPNPDGLLNTTEYVSAASQRGRDLLNSLGLAPVTQTEQLTGALGQLNIAGFSPIGVDVSNFPQARANNTFQVAYTFTQVLRKHVLTTGFDISRPQINSELEKGYRPQAVFQGLLGSGDPAREVFTGATLAAIGAPTGLFQTISPTPNPNIGIRFAQINFFFQDEFRFNSKLRFNLGMRYELSTVPHTKDGRLEKNFNEQDLLKRVSANAGECQSNQSDPRCQALLSKFSNAFNVVFPDGFRNYFGGDRSGFNPRVGFAWDIEGDGRRILRGGFGVYNSPFQGIVVSQSRNAFPDFLSLNLANYSPKVTVGSQLSSVLLNLTSPGLSSSLNLLKAGTLNQLSQDIDPIGILVKQQFNPLGFNLALPQRKLKHPYSYHYSLTFENRFSEYWAGSIAYVGARGLKLLRVSTPDSGLNYSGIDLNAIMPLGSTSSPDFPFFAGSLKPSDKSRGVTDALTVARMLFESSASSTYNSLQIEARRRYSGNLQVGTAFTLSHAIDDASDFFDLAGAFALSQNSIRPSERASSSFDIRTRSVTHFLWEPLSLLLNGGRHTLIQRFQIAGIVTAQSGQPYTVNSAVDINRDGNLTDRLNTVSGLIQGGDVERRAQLGLGAGVRSLDLLAGDGGEGLIGRNTFRAPRIVNVDLAFNTHFDLRDKYRFVFRTEIFNLFNRAQFGAPDRILESPAFGRSVRTVMPARAIQFAVKVAF